MLTLNIDPNAEIRRSNKYVLATKNAQNSNKASLYSSVKKFSPKPLTKTISNIIFSK